MRARRHTTAPTPHYTGRNTAEAERFLAPVSALPATTWLHAADLYAPLRNRATFLAADDVLARELEVTGRGHPTKALVDRVLATGGDVRAAPRDSPSFDPAAREVAELAAISTVLAVAGRDRFTPEQFGTLTYAFAQVLGRGLGAAIA